MACWGCAQRASMFQSSPGPRAGRCLSRNRGLQQAFQVSILARPKGRALPTVPTSSAALRPSFQSSPGPRAGRCPEQRPFAALLVSILARPKGRALLVPWIVSVPVRLSFQSSPGPRAGRCPLVVQSWTRGDRVSILARPKGRALRDSALGGLLRGLQVSILARPKGRALPVCAGSTSGSAGSFNPRPAQGPGAACGTPATGRERRRGFNPRPAQGPGAASTRLNPKMAIAAFQSSPGPRAGRCRGIEAGAIAAMVFQSSPGPRAGRCWAA